MRGIKLNLAASATFILLGATLLSPLGQAADADDQKAKAENEATANTAPPPKSKTEKSKTDSGDARVFIPTEEISEDFAVSFPVDI